MPSTDSPTSLPLVTSPRRFPILPGRTTDVHSGTVRVDALLAANPYADQHGMYCINPAMLGTWAHRLEHGELALLPRDQPLVRVYPRVTDCGVRTTHAGSPELWAYLELTPRQQRALGRFGNLARWFTPLTHFYPASFAATDPPVVRVFADAVQHGDSPSPSTSITALTRDAHVAVGMLYQFVPHPDPIVVEIALHESGRIPTADVFDRLGEGLGGAFQRFRDATAVQFHLHIVSPTTNHRALAVGITTNDVRELAAACRSCVALLDQPGSPAMCQWRGGMTVPVTARASCAEGWMTDGVSRLWNCRAAVE